MAFEELFNGTTNERAAFASNVKEVVPGVEMIYGFVNTEEHQIKGANLGQKTITLGDGAEAGRHNEFWQLETDEYIDLSFAIKLDEHAGNDYQGSNVLHRIDG